MMSFLITPSDQFCL
uniref:Uncharacterized protein n=1 Tax=Lotus japonicus TaxID=34305 RepID=I3T740_LOTJA|nr:unknown [Lotus japonicus]